MYGKKPSPPPMRKKPAAPMPPADPKKGRDAGEVGKSWDEMFKKK